MALNTRAFVHQQLDGRAFWRLLSKPRQPMREILTPTTCPKEFLYDFSRSRLFTQATLPPILYMMLPRLSSEPEVLFFEIEAVISKRPKSSLAQHYLFLFEWLRRRYAKKIWVERSGASLMFVGSLYRMFPNAKFVHLFRDGRDVALSMRAYPPLSLLAESWKSARRWGVDILAPPFRIGESSLIAALEGALAPLHGVGKRLKRKPSPALCGEFWSRMVVNGLETLATIPDNQKLSFSYESLVEAPVAALGKLISFVGAPPPRANWIDWACDLVQRPQPRHYALSMRETDALEKACRPGLTALGYNSRSRTENARKIPCSATMISPVS